MLNFMYLQRKKSFERIYFRIVLIVYRTTMLRKSKMKLSAQLDRKFTSIL
jgi:hypothetical protein